MRKRIFGLLALVMLAALGAGCAAQPQTISQAGPRTWIDAPLDSSATFTDPLHPGDPIHPGAPIQPGDPVQVISHSTDLFPVVEVELSVNGQVIHSDPNPDQTQVLAAMTQTWTPTAPGNYTLKVRTRNSNGVWGVPTTIVVTIGGATPTPAPNATSGPLVQVPPGGTSGPLATIPPNGTSGPLATVPPNVTSGPLPPGAATLPAVGLAFFADPAAVAAGQCTTIHWQATNSALVFLDNQSVAFSGTKQDCPAQTITHSLHVVTLDNQSVDRSITIQVSSSTATPVPQQAQASCSGAPVIASFGATSTQINAGNSTTLQWGAVTNADSVQIDQGIGGVAAPGSKAISPGSTTTYTLTARCGSNAATRQVTVVVNAAQQQQQVSSAIKKGNLIVNGDAEASSSPQDWSAFLRTPLVAVAAYGAPGGFPDKNTPGPSNRGKNLFVGGPGAATSEGIQNIDLSSWGPDAFALIDASKVSFQFGAWLGGYADQDDNAIAEVSFISGIAKGSVLGQATLTGPNAAARNNTTSLVAKNASGKVPAGTRSIEVQLRFVRTSGDYNDGSADDLSLTLSVP